MYRYVDTLDDILDLREWFGRQPYIALDTETTGVNVFDKDFHVRLIQFGNKNDAWVMHGERWTGFVDDILRDFQGRIVIHNSAFDVAALAASNITVPWEKIDDTLIAMRLAEPQRNAGLKDVAGRLISSTAANSQQELHTAMKKYKWGWDTVPHDLPEYRFYAGMDVILTSRLYEHEICRRGLASPVYEMEMDVRAICSAMEHGGMRVDIPFAQETADRFRQEADNLSQQIQNEQGFSISSGPQLAKWLLERGVKLSVLTGGGSPSVSKDALEVARYSATGEAAHVMDAVLRSRRITKLARSYFDNFVNMSTDGLLHPQIQTLQARTGRMSITNPAMQTLPRVSEDDPDAKLVRQAIIPREDNHLIVSSDFSQIELRIIASLSEDPALIAAFREADETEGDIFVSAMRLVYNDPTLTKSDNRRALIKNTFYGSAYGAGISKMAQTAKVSVEDMRSVADAVFGRFAGMRRYMKVCEKESIDNDNWITTPMGRRIWVDPDRSYKALNSKVQSFAGDIFKTTMVNLAHAGLTDYMVCPVHDEVVFSIPESEIEEVSHVISEVMPYNNLLVSVPADPSPGVKDWSLAK
jgi:DNA polymerase-1